MAAFAASQQSPTSPEARAACCFVRQLPKLPQKQQQWRGEQRIASSLTSCTRVGCVCGRRQRHLRKGVASTDSVCQQAAHASTRAREHTTRGYGAGTAEKCVGKAQARGMVVPGGDARHCPAYSIFYLSFRLFLPLPDFFSSFLFFLSSSRFCLSVMTCEPHEKMLASTENVNPIHQHEFEIYSEGLRRIMSRLK
jgi:hypothetical protein